MTDVSGNDKRSVKASLAGRGDMRAAWWNFSSYVLQKVNKYSLEHAMYDFHRGHHGVYFFVLETRRHVQHQSMLDSIQFPYGNKI